MYIKYFTITSFDRKGTNRTRKIFEGEVNGFDRLETEHRCIVSVLGDSEDMKMTRVFVFPLKGQI